jgi:hypothetical protein
MEHIYGVNSNLTLRCDSHIYHVHRDILSQASPVFMSLLEGPFAEASTNIITLEGDNPASLKVVIDIIYSGILDLYYGEISEEDTNLDIIVNKYDLTGVRNVITFSRKMDKTVGNSIQRRRGVIISNDKDNRTEIWVRWDDGTGGHSLKCCKTNKEDLLHL